MQSGGQIGPKDKHHDENQDNLNNHRLNQEFRAFGIRIDVDFFHGLSFFERVLTKYGGAA